MRDFPCKVYLEEVSKHYIKWYHFKLVFMRPSRFFGHWETLPTLRFHGDNNLRRSRRSSLPLELRGSVSTKWSARGTL